MRFEVGASQLVDNRSLIVSGQEPVVLFQSLDRTKFIARQSVEVCMDFVKSDLTIEVGQALNLSLLV